MIASDYILREIQLKDNEQIAHIIRGVLIEMGVPKIGSTYEDKTLDNLYGFYQKDKAIYYVIEYQNRIIGGGGIAQLGNFEGNTCELQKMYFLPETRGKGLGTKMIEKCLAQAKEFGFDECYLETMPYMKAAQNLYKKNGFIEINNPIGNTCHYSCDVWMIRKL
tara:strand:+ start:46004 stop:46495 length:492 start_codon:yes stop_codon:yes gene_type:complete